LGEKGVLRGVGEREVGEREVGEGGERERVVRIKMRC